jgi:cob(I)alamin adenosyltransferase
LPKGGNTVVIYTKTGDKGKTSLYDGTRIDKDSIRVESYGTVDELNCAIGVAKNFIEDKDTIQVLEDIQSQLFDVGAELATVEKTKYVKRITQEKIEALEKVIDQYMAKSKPVTSFIIPGTNKPSAFLHLARTICRRAERRIITLSHHEEVSPEVVKFVNRLSDVIYAIARCYEEEIKEIKFSK